MSNARKTSGNFDVPVTTRGMSLPEDHKTEVVMWLVSGVAFLLAILLFIAAIWAGDVRWVQTAWVFGGLSIGSFIGGWITVFIKFMIDDL